MSEGSGYVLSSTLVTTCDMYYTQVGKWVEDQDMYYQGMVHDGKLVICTEKVLIG